MRDPAVGWAVATMGGAPGGRVLPERFRLLLPAEAFMVTDAEI
jgi:hypothetical protein